MVRIVANEDFVAKLADLTEAAEVYDASGQLLGRFEPFPSKNWSKEGYYIPNFDEEDLAKIELQPDGRKLSEIWEGLRGQ